MCIKVEKHCSVSVRHTSCKVKKSFVVIFAVITRHRCGGFVALWIDNINISVTHPAEPMLLDRAGYVTLNAAVTLATSSESTLSELTFHLTRSATSVSQCSQCAVGESPSRNTGSPLEQPEDPPFISAYLWEIQTCRNGKEFKSSQKARRQRRKKGNDGREREQKGRDGAEMK
jgi:hypothetical protein